MCLAVSLTPQLSLFSTSLSTFRKHLLYLWQGILIKLPSTLANNSFSDCFFLSHSPVPHSPWSPFFFVSLAHLHQPVCCSSVSLFFTVSDPVSQNHSQPLILSSACNHYNHCSLTISQSEWFLRQTLRSQCRYTTE